MRRISTQLRDKYPDKVFRYCPRCTEKLRPVRGSNSLRCTVCRFHLFYNPATATTALIRDTKGRLLFTRRAHEPAMGSWDLPGGFVSPMESAEDCIRREIAEELNIRLGNLAFFCSMPNRYLYSDMVVFTTDIVFLADLPPRSRIRPADDVSEHAFFAPSEIDPAELGLESARGILKLYVKTRRLGKASK